ncbi:hypothetical protein EVAR_83711_1 [Eumeta japonica]|uniref:Uncharacterized protein n=1 Tax=Eumeta variegata TaxID=151549 RepID=A0A4C1WAV2_EUMVA|nr:hypothetical protein EVAR_83711_1 [Eumeta japonica]
MQLPTPDVVSYKTRRANERVRGRNVAIRRLDCTTDDEFSETYRLAKTRSTTPRYERDTERSRRKHDLITILKLE